MERNEKHYDQIIGKALRSEQPKPDFVDAVMARVESEAQQRALQTKPSPRFSAQEVMSIGVLALLACTGLVLSVDAASPYEMLNNLLNSEWFVLFESPLYAVGFIAVAGLLMADHALRSMSTQMI